MTAPTAAATARDGRPASVASPTPSNGWCGRTSPGGRTGRPGQIRLELGNPLIILLGMDRLNYSKGILHRLRAYGSLLDSGLLRPQQAVFVQVASPRQDRVEQYQQLLQEVEALVGRINDEQTTLAQPAIRYLHHSYPREEIAALYLTADIMLVTSLRDGMNLVAKNTSAAVPTKTAHSCSANSPVLSASPRLLVAVHEIGSGSGSSRRIPSACGTRSLDCNTPDGSPPAAP